MDFFNARKLFEALSNSSALWLNEILLFGLRLARLLAGMRLKYQIVDSSIFSLSRLVNGSALNSIRSFLWLIKQKIYSRTLMLRGFWPYRMRVYLIAVIDLLHNHFIFPLLLSFVRVHNIAKKSSIRCLLLVLISCRFYFVRNFVLT